MVNSFPATTHEKGPITSAAALPEAWELLTRQVQSLEDIRLVAKLSPCLATMGGVALELQEPCLGTVTCKAEWKQQKPDSPEAQHPRASVNIGQLVMTSCIHDGGLPKIMGPKARAGFNLEDKFFAAMTGVSLSYEYGRHRDSSTRRLKVAKADSLEEIDWFMTHLEAVKSADPAKLPKLLVPASP